MTGPVLSACDISMVFGGVVALDKASIDVKPGHVFGLIGRNGSGKSTLFNCLTGFLAPSSGKVLLDGKDITGHEPHEVMSAGVARTFQNLQMFSDMSTLEAVVTGRTRQRKASLFANLLITPAVRREEEAAFDAARELLISMGVPQSFWLRRAGDLPYGLQRRVEIARALATEPLYLLLDEPAAGLNDKASTAVGEALLKLAKQGIGVVLIEHDIELVMNISSTIFVMDAGTVIASGTPAEVRKNPHVIAAYLGDENE